MIITKKVILRIFILLIFTWISKESKCTWSSEEEDIYLIPLIQVQDGNSVSDIILSEFMSSKNFLCSSQIEDQKSLARDKNAEECCLSYFLIFLKKYLCSSSNQYILGDEKEEVLVKIDGFSPRSNAYVQSKFEILPNDILWKIYYNLSELENFKLLLVSQRLNRNINAIFWENYLKFHEKDKWNPFLEGINVARAFAFFEKGEIEKAAKLGFPKAIIALSKKRAEKKPQNIRYDTLYESSSSSRSWGRKLGPFI